MPRPTQNIENKCKLGKILIQKLESINKNQKWLSNETGISRCYVSQIISGKYKPSVATLHKISKVLNIDIEILISMMVS